MAKNLETMKGYGSYPSPRAKFSFRIGDLHFSDLSEVRLRFWVMTKTESIQILGRITRLPDGWFHFEEERPRKNTDRCLIAFRNVDWQIYSVADAFQDGKPPRHFPPLDRFRDRMFIFYIDGPMIIPGYEFGGGRIVQSEVTSLKEATSEKER
jgi:hypothetical protein